MFLVILQELFLSAGSNSRNVLRSSPGTSRYIIYKTENVFFIVEFKEIKKGNKINLKQSL